MSREMQNIVMGGLGFVVAVVTMIAATIYLTRPDDTDTIAVQPLAGEANPIDASGADSGLPEAASPEASGERPTATLDVAAASANALPSSTTSSLSTTTSTTVATSSTTAASSTTSTTEPTTTSTTAEETSLEEVSTTVTVEAQVSTTMSTDSSTTSESLSSTSSTMVDSSDTTVPAETTVVSIVSSSTTTEQATTTTIEPTTTTAAPPTTAGSGELNEVEREILRLTNELRTNPNGPLARRGPVINCGGRVRVDEAGKYEPIGAVEGHLVASLQVSRPWSAHMTIDNFEHQPRAGVAALQAAGIQVRAAGENIAYTSFPDKAQRFFTGWRESDGHFCNMMDPNYTHLGVGEVTKIDQRFEVSFATQNFFSTR